MQIDIGINGLNKKIKKIEVGINGQWKECKKGEVGILGNWKQTYSSCPFNIIKGDSNAGYGGKITGFLTYNDLLSKVNFKANNPTQKVFGDIEWLQFIYNGKILYASNQVIMTYILYAELEQLGVVDGSKIIQIGDKSYKVRLFHGGTYANSTKTFAPTNTFAYYVPNDTNEWTDLMFNLLTDLSTLKINSDLVNNYYESWTIREAGEGMWYESGVNYPKYPVREIAAVQGNISPSPVEALIDSIDWGKNNYSSGIGWRPVLELID